MRPRKGIILAAGDGGRLRPLTATVPKALLNVGGHPLIRWPIAAMLSAGITEIAVVVGYHAEQVMAALNSKGGGVGFLNFIENPYWEGGNALSLDAARAFVGSDPFVMCMGDHPISPKIMKDLLDNEYDGPVLCTDSQPQHPWQINDATRVVIGPEGSVLAIGKELTSWTAVDTGVFLLGDYVFDGIDHLKRSQGIEVEMTELVRLFADRNDHFSACDIDGAFWADVDTVEDLQATDLWMCNNQLDGE